MKFLENINKKRIFKKTCVLRVDLNIKEDDKDFSLRILRILPTIKYLIKNKCKIVILSHRGQPSNNAKQMENNTLSDLSLRNISGQLSKLINKKIYFDNSFDFKKIHEQIKKSDTGSIFMLENIRFCSEEDNNDLKLSKQLASLGDFYVNDAFSVSHRKHVSICGITIFLPSYGGIGLRNEVTALGKVIKNPKKPIMLVLGGAKISDKIEVLNKFVNFANNILIGGAIANTFFAAKKMPIGKSVYDKNSIPVAEKFIGKKNILIPIDVVISDKKILDIGENSVDLYGKILKKAKTIIWNGPMGFTENKKFAHGTAKIAQIIGKSKAFSVVGGGETTSFLIKNKLDKNASFLSTGGGAMLDFISGKKLPGLEALERNKKLITDN